jgi:hypothetical protein
LNDVKGDDHESIFVYLYPMAKNKKAIKPPSTKSLFHPIYPDKKLNPTFKGLSTLPAKACTRRMMNEAFSNFDDVDGNFVEQFQTAGLDSRTWELYLNCYFKSFATVARPKPSPDFILTTNLGTVAVEAVVTRASEFDLEEEPKAGDPYQEARYRHENTIPIKFGSSLYSKLKKKYWESSNAQGLPLVLAIAPFHSEEAVSFSDVGLVNYLYGISTHWKRDADGKLVVEEKSLPSHSHGKKEIPSGFFSLPDTENISAILFNNSGTVARFTRMAIQAGYSNSDIVALRAGTAYNPDPNSTDPFGFIYQVGDPHFTESWSDGTVILYNLNARYPLHFDYFPGATHHLHEDGEMVCYVPDKFVVLSSRTFVAEAKGLANKVQLQGIIGPDPNEGLGRLLKMQTALLSLGKKYGRIFGCAVADLIAKGYLK